MEQFEKEVGYPFRAEYIINKGFNNSTFCVPTKEYRDFMDFQQREVSKLAKKFVDICHEYGKEAMMFLGITGLVQSHLENILNPLDWMRL